MWNPSDEGIDNGYWVFGRPTVEELGLDWRALLQQCGHGGTSAARRSECAKGERATFYPYGETRLQVVAPKSSDKCVNLSS
jgi:hypothetical protein